MKNTILFILIFISTVSPSFALNQDKKELKIQNSNLIVFRDGAKLVTLTTDGNISSSDIDRNPWPKSGHNIAYRIVYSQNNLILIKKEDFITEGGNTSYFICDLNQKIPSLVKVRLTLHLRGFAGGFSDGWGIIQPQDFLVKNKKLYLTTLVSPEEELGTQKKYYIEFKEKLLKKGYKFLHKAEDYNLPLDVYGLEIKSLYNIYTITF